MTRLTDDARGFSILIATLMTIVVLLVLGCVMSLMVIDVTLGDTSAWGGTSEYQERFRQLHDQGYCAYQLRD